MDRTLWGWVMSYWEFVFIVAIPFTWNLIMRYKRRILDEVYATKQEVRQALDEVKEEVHKTIHDHAQEDQAFQRDLRERMDTNHNEIKNLIIRHLGKHHD